MIVNEKMMMNIELISGAVYYFLWLVYGSTYRFNYAEFFY